MSRLLSRIGIGSATVDTVLPRTELRPGEHVEATIDLTGGSADQTIDALYFALLTRVDGEDRVVDEFQLAESLTLPAGEERTLTTEVHIPPWTPLTRGDRRVWLETGLDVAWAVDPEDSDEVTVVPGPYLEALFAATDALGFEPHDVSVREPEWLDRPLVQAFRYVPTADPFVDQVDALTLVTAPREGDLKTIVELDEREDAEAHTDIAYDQQEIVTVFDSDDPEMVRRRLRNTIDQHLHT